MFSVNKWINKKISKCLSILNNDNNKFVLFLRKGFYPYAYMDRWERFNEISLPDKIAFYSELILEDITDEDYAHSQKVWEEFEIKKTLVSIMTCIFKVIHYCL